MQFYQICEPEETREMESAVAVGIDLGTTNSLVAISRNGKVDVITVDRPSAESTHDTEQGQLLPSLVYFGENDEVYVGTAAKAFLGVSRSHKRLMNMGSEHKLTVGEKVISPFEISAEILKTLKQAAEDFLGHEIKKAVITVPAYFDDAGRSATHTAAIAAGLEPLRLMNEPTAAAFAYGLQNKSDGLFAVYDLGGGTFDISILKMQSGIFKVIAVAGDTNLGGDDLDSALCELLCRKCNLTYLEDDNSLLAMDEIRQIKEYLTDNLEWVASSGSFFPGCSVTKEEFEEAITPLVAKTVDLFKKALIDANCSLGSHLTSLGDANSDEFNKKEVLDAIILVGGSTRVPAIKSILSRQFDVPLLDQFDPDKIVVIGAAIQAEALSSGNSDNLLVDVNPLSLGLEILGGLVEVIIPRNSPIPIEITKVFTTSQDSQTAFKLHILQGESDKVDLCRSLARFELKNIPPAPAGSPRLSVTFRVDADGILTVFAEEIKNGIKQQIEVLPSYGLSLKVVESLLRIA